MIPPDERKGPAWAWTLQAALEAQAATVLTTLGLLTLGLILSWATVQSWPWICTYWGVPLATQATAIGTFAGAIYALGLAGGYALATIGQ